MQLLIFFIEIHLLRGFIWHESIWRSLDLTAYERSGRSEASVQFGWVGVGATEIGLSTERLFCRLPTAPETICYCITDGCAYPWRFRFSSIADERVVINWPYRCVDECGYMLQRSVVYTGVCRCVSQTDHLSSPHHRVSQSLYTLPSDVALRRHGRSLSHSKCFYHLLCPL